MDTPKDVKNLPHYTQFKIQPLDFFRANIGVLDFLQCNVIKYVCRYKMKNGREDLLKARNYIDKMLEDYDNKQAGEGGAFPEIFCMLHEDSAYKCRCTGIPTPIAR